MYYEAYHNDPPCSNKLEKSGFCLACGLFPDMQSTALVRVLEKDDKVKFNEHTLTYTGTRREIKGVLFDFFTTEKGETVFFTPSEVSEMQNIK